LLWLSVPCRELKRSPYSIPIKRDGTVFVTCCWEHFLFFQPITLHLSCSWPASSSVGWLCPQSTVDRLGQNLFCRTLHLFTHTLAFWSCQNVKTVMTHVFFLYTCHVNISIVCVVLDITGCSALLFLQEAFFGAWRPLQSYSVMSGNNGWADSWIYGLLSPVWGGVRWRLISRKVHICSGYTLSFFLSHSQGNYRAVRQQTIFVFSGMLFRFFFPPMGGSWHIVEECKLF